MTELGRLALARTTVDRSAHLRTDGEWLARIWADEHTRVLVLDDGRALVSDAHALVLLPPSQAPDGDRFLLGVAEDGVAYFAVSAPLPVVEGAKPEVLRVIGALLSDRDAGLLTQSIALINWHSTHTHCPRCGAPTEIDHAGYMRVCRADGSQHFPRNDPAVIMLVFDEGGPDGAARCLLARHPDWPPKRASILAGFVEPGESLEQAVIREVAEEVGVRVNAPRYLGSQPWPFPSSLMLAFITKAENGQALTPDREEICDAAWYTREALLAAVEAEEIMLPSQVSIARRVIESWYGAALPGQW